MTPEEHLEARAERILDSVLPEPCSRCNGTGWYTYYIGEHGREWFGQIACCCD